MAKPQAGDEAFMRDYSIVLAADLATAEQVSEIVKEVGPVIDGLKIGVPTILECGVQILPRLSDLIEEKPLLLDLKVADIGFNSKGKWTGTNSKIISRLKGSGVTHITVHGFPGPASIAESIHQAHEIGIEVLLLPTMSHPGAELFFSHPFQATILDRVSETSVQKPMEVIASANDVTEAILILGETLDVDGYIGPATKPPDLEKYRKISSKPIWCPGFGRQDRLGRNITQQLESWAKIVGPSSAAIIGSMIFEAKSPYQAALDLKIIRDKVVE